MTLEDAEKLARKILDEVARGYTPDESWSDAVADALVAILPVVKAAEAWRDQHRRRWEQTERRSPDPLYVRVPDDVLELADAIDAMRARMGEK